MHSVVGSNSPGPLHVWSRFDGKEVLQPCSMRASFLDTPGNLFTPRRRDAKAFLRETVVDAFNAKLRDFCLISYTFTQLFFFFWLPPLLQ